MTDVDSAAILRSQILPMYFPDEAATEPPSLTLLTGQPGSGKSRATGHLLAERAPDMAVVSAEDLRAFHPSFAELTGRGPVGGTQELAQITAGWVAGCVRFARESRRSLLLEGTFHDPSVVAATTAGFEAAGFDTRFVVVASRRAESLLSVTSRYARDLQAGASSQYISRTAHDRAFNATRTLVAAMEEAPSTDRLTVLGRDGQVVFDGRRNEGADAFRGAGAALAAAQSARMSRWDATQWLSELHHVTEFATDRQDLPRGVVESLVDLHEVSLREVLPELRVPAAGRFASAMEQRTVARLVTLRRSVATERQADHAAPVVAPSGPQQGGVSL